MPRSRAVRASLTAPLTALTVLLAVTACSSGSSSDADAGTAAAGPSALASAKGPVTVTVWHGLGGPAGTAFQQQVDAFNAANSGRIQVKAVYQGSYADTMAKYTSAVRDESTPSILVTNDITTGIVRDTGQTVTAQSMAAANPGDLDLDQLVPAARSYYTSGGTLLAVPLATSMPMLYVNDALLAKAKIDRSTLGTLDGVAAAARAVRAAEPAVAGIVQPFDGWWYEQLTAGAGQTYCNPGNGRVDEGATAVNLTSPAQEKAFGTMANLYTTKVGLDTGTDGNAALTAFATGKVAMMLNSSGSIGGLTTAGMKGYSVLPYPISGPRESSGPLIGGAAMWVSGPGHAAAERAASWKVISYLASAKAQEPFTQASGYTPVNTEVAKSATQQAFLKVNPARKVLSDQLADTPATTATSGCLSGAMTGIRNVVVAQMQSAFAGQESIATALTTAQTQATKAVTDYREQAGQ